MAQAVPTYTMSVFKLSNTLCYEMTSMVHKFWRGLTNERNKMAWLSWDKMCLPKDEGGLGFRDLKAFTLALLAKQGWRLQTNITLLVHKVFKAQYFPEGDFLSAKLSNHPSYTWRSIMASQPIIQTGHCWQVGNGHSLQIWRDKWLIQPSTFSLTSRSPTVPS